MPQRLDEFNKKFIYTDTNPENIIAGRKNALFFRKNEFFYFNADGNLDGHWQKLPYRTVIIPPPVLTKLIKFRTPTELWIKTTDGYLDEFNEVLPKTGWKFMSYKDVFSTYASSKAFHWLFPAPTSTNDPVGIDGQRSYDENYFYAKISGKWYRTPIVRFSEPGTSSPDNSYWETNLPFVDTPRYIPVPPNSSYPGIEGDQSYDLDFFYIRVGAWKRSHLLVFYNGDKMAVF